MTYFVPEEFEDVYAFHGYIAGKYSQKRKNAEERGLDFDLTLPQFVQIFNRRKCPYTGEALTYFKRGETALPTQASIDRIDNSKGYVKGNVVLCTEKVNGVKGTLSLKELEKMVTYMKRNKK